MSGGEWDPCECVWNHENAMRRLINLLRSTQTQCTENECLQTNVLESTGTPSSGDYSVFLLMMGWLVLATALFIFRPKSLRSNADHKPVQGPNNSDPDPDPPAVS